MKEIIYHFINVEEALQGLTAPYHRIICKNKMMVIEVNFGTYSAGMQIDHLALIIKLESKFSSFFYRKYLVWDLETFKFFLLGSGTFQFKKGNEIRNFHQLKKKVGNVYYRVVDDKVEIGVADLGDAEPFKTKDEVAAYFAACCLCYPDKIGTEANPLWDNREFQPYQAHNAWWLSYGNYVFKFDGKLKRFAVPAQKPTTARA